MSQAVTVNVSRIDLIANVLPMQHPMLWRIAARCSGHEFILRDARMFRRRVTDMRQRVCLPGRRV